MSSNTPNVQKQYTATTATLNTVAGELGQLVVDTDKHTAVVMDGAKLGGYPLALEARKVKSATEALKVNGGTEGDLSGDLTLTIDEEALAGDVWVKRVEGAVPTGATLTTLLADVPHGGLVYFTAG